MGKFAQLSSHQAFVFLQNCARWTFSIPGHTRRNARVMPPTCTPQSVPITQLHGPMVLPSFSWCVKLPLFRHVATCNRCKCTLSMAAAQDVELDAPTGPLEKKIANGHWNIQKLLQPTASWQTKWLISRRFMISSIWIEFGSEDGRCWMLAWENCRSISHHG